MFVCFSIEKGHTRSLDEVTSHNEVADEVVMILRVRTERCFLM